MGSNKLVYIASPYAGDVEENVAFAKAACRYAMEQDVTPVAVHLLYPQMLADHIPAEREAGIRMGMRAELAAAQRLGIPARRIADIPQETPGPQPEPRRGMVMQC